jgi:hypothetical protein
MKNIKLFLALIAISAAGVGSAQAVDPMYRTYGYHVSIYEIKELLAEAADSLHPLVGISKASTAKSIAISMVDHAKWIISKGYKSKFLEPDSQITQKEYEQSLKEAYEKLVKEAKNLRIKIKSKIPAPPSTAFPEEEMLAQPFLQEDIVFWACGRCQEVIRHSRGSEGKAPAFCVFCSTPKPLPPLLDGWLEYGTSKGRSYYHNAVLQRTQWDRPIE